MGFRVSATIILFLGMLVAIATAQYGGPYDNSNIGSTNSSPALMLALVAFIISFFVIIKERI